MEAIAAVSGTRSRLFRTANGIRTSLNRDRSRLKRPIIDRLETGEVLLTATIRKVFRQLLDALVAGDPAASQQIGELPPGYGGQLSGLSKRERPLGIKRKGEFTLQPLFPLVLGQMKASIIARRNHGRSKILEAMKLRAGQNAHP